MATRYSLIAGRNVAIGIARADSEPRLVILGARIVLVEVAIGEAQAGDRTAEASVVNLLHLEARLNRQARQMRAHRCALDPERAGRQSGEVYVAAAARTNGAHDRAVGENAAEASGAIETAVGEQLADHECPGLLWSELLGDGRGGSQNARTDNSNAQQHEQLHFELED